MGKMKIVMANPEVEASRFDMYKGFQIAKLFSEVHLQNF